MSICFHSTWDRPGFVEARCVGRKIGAKGSASRRYPPELEVARWWLVDRRPDTRRARRRCLADGPVAASAATGPDLAHSDHGAQYTSWVSSAAPAAIAIHKPSFRGRSIIIEIGHEEMLARFDSFITRLHLAGESHRSLVVADDLILRGARSAPGAGMEARRGASGPPARHDWKYPSTWIPERRTSFKLLTSLRGRPGTTTSTSTPSTCNFSMAALTVTMAYSTASLTWSGDTTDAVARHAGAGVSGCAVAAVKLLPGRRSAPPDSRPL